MLFVIGGALIALAAWQAERRHAVIFGVVIATALGALWVYELSDILDRIDTVKNEGTEVFFVDVNVGAGMGHRLRVRDRGCR